MPAEYVMSLDQGHVKVGGLEFARATQATARTSSSLYLSIYQVRTSIRRSVSYVF